MMPPQAVQPAAQGDRGARTSDLIKAIATGAGAAPRGLVVKRLGPALLLGLVASVALATGTLGLAPAAKALDSVLWIKLGYCAALTVAAMRLSVRLSQPGARVPPAALAMAAVFATMAVAAVLDLPPTASGVLIDATSGAPWAICAGLVLLVSLPALALTIRAFRGLAPLRPWAAGFAAGLLAGAVGALGYSVACPVESIYFIALWYSLGILLTAALGAAIGSRALRW